LTGNQLSRSDSKRIGFVASEETDFVPTADKNAIKPIITMIAVDAIAEDIMIKFLRVCTVFEST
jgi:hypothetical protein